MKVLIVDDDPEIRESLRDVLEIEGYDVGTAANGREALDRLDAEVPALVLLDLMMPIMSGGELLSVLRKKDALAELPVVVLSAWPAEAVKVGRWAQGFLKKPTRLEELLSIVEKFCGPPEGEPDEGRSEQ
jgi:DNA-binding response OmpR family regulator